MRLHAKAKGEGANSCKHCTTSYTEKTFGLMPMPMSMPSVVSLLFNCY